jgi:hypothetical protein
MKTESIGQYLLIFERTPTGIVNVSAVPDTGETIRARFIGYGEAQILREMRALLGGNQ